jgi:hypothetical protein
MEPLAAIARQGEMTTFAAKLQELYPAGVETGTLQEIMALIYVDKKNLKNAIEAVLQFDVKQQAAAYKALYGEIKDKKHTGEPEILLLQKKIRLVEEPGHVLDETMKQVDEDCKKIISRIVKGIDEKDYSISIYVAEELDKALLNENMVTIVQEFFTGSLENTLLLIQYSQGLPYIDNSCFLIDALLKELEKRQLLDSMQAMHLWAHAKWTKEETPNWPNVAASTQKLCTDVLEKLSVNKEKFFRHYQKYVEDPDKQKIKDLHDSNWHLQSIVRDFVSFYFNGDEVGRTQNLLAAANANIQYSASGRILSQVYEEMAKSDQLKSFEAFRLFNVVKRKMSTGNFNSALPQEKKPFEDLKEKAAACMRQLLWSDESMDFRLVNKFKSEQLFFTPGDNKVGCRIPGDDHNEQLWLLDVIEETSLLSIRPKSGNGELGIQGDGTVGVVPKPGFRWMIKPLDDDHFKIFTEKGKCEK